jgi:hypothetical protein
MQVILTKELIETRRGQQAAFSFLVGYSAEERAMYAPDWNVNVDVTHLGLRQPVTIGYPGWAVFAWVVFASVRDGPGVGQQCVCTHIRVDARTDDRVFLNLPSVNAEDEFGRLCALYERRKLIAEQTHERFMAVRGPQISGATGPGEDANLFIPSTQARREVEAARLQERERAALRLDYLLSQVRQAPRFPFPAYHPQRHEYGVAKNDLEWSVMLSLGWTPATGEERTEEAPRKAGRRIVKAGEE